jgi:hypothetical protein
MPATWPETSQMTIRELADFSSSLTQSLARIPDSDKLRPALDEALSAECVQCQIKLTGADLLKFGAGETETDPKLERLKTGYCARNGCDSHYYRVHCAPHPQLDWPKILNPAQEIVTAATESERVAKKLARLQRHHKNILRTATAIGVLLLVLILRQIYIGGTIPFIREPENFKVDRGAAENP